MGRPLTHHQSHRARKAAPKSLHFQLLIQQFSYTPSEGFSRETLSTRFLTIIVQNVLTSGGSRQVIAHACGSRGFADAPQAVSPTCCHNLRFFQCTSSFRFTLVSRDSLCAVSNGVMSPRARCDLHLRTRLETAPWPPGEGFSGSGGRETRRDRRGTGLRTGDRLPGLRVPAPCLARPCCASRLADLPAHGRWGSGRGAYPGTASRSRSRARWPGTRAPASPPACSPCCR